MSPKKQAKELVDKITKQSVLIAVEYLIQDASKINIHLGRGGLSDYEYWVEVKEEIEVLIDAKL